MEIGLLVLQNPCMTGKKNTLVFIQVNFYRIKKNMSHNWVLVNWKLTGFGGRITVFLNNRNTTLPYFGKRKQVTYHPNLSYWCFHNSHNELFFQAKFHAETLILLRDMSDNTSWYSIDVSVKFKWWTHFALLREMSLLSLASFCQIRAVQP